MLSAQRPLASAARGPAARPALAIRTPARARVAVRAVEVEAATEAVATEAASAIHVLTGETYHDFLAANEMVVVDYYTEWCGPCKLIAPHYEAMAAEMSSIKFAKLNCTTEAAAKKIAMAQGIKALPTFHAFRKGERVGVFVGSKINQLRSFVEQHAASA